MKRVTLLITFAIYLSFSANAQQLTQTIRGVIVDKQSQQPLTGVNVVIIESEPLLGTTTNENGEFRIENVSVGRQGIQCSFVSYEPVMLRNLILSSGKELVLKIEMEEKVIVTDEVTIKAYRKDKPINEMATVSARSFTVEETERFAGSWGDPARMASSFAGVMVAGDQVNDIIIRGNSPNSLLWRLEGINVPNPNHFGGVGTTGGPVSMLNNNVLSNSDFYTGAFTAEYGNALSGVFDLRMRSGNNEKREFLGQVGFNGFELGAEGPFSQKSRASYLANYRYSTLGLVSKLGMSTGTGTAVPYYQDLTFKIDLPTKKLGRFTLFGLGGLSYIDFNYDKGDTVRSGTHFTSDMGVTGLSHTYFFSPTARIKTSIALSGTRTTTKSWIYKKEDLDQFYGNRSTEVKYIFNTELSKKFTAKDNGSMGVSVEQINVNYLDSVYLKDWEQYYNLVDEKGSFALMQAYATAKHRFTEALSMVAGLHYQQTTLNTHVAFEPRASIQYEFNNKQSISLGYGLHSQLQPRLVYFTTSLLDTANHIYKKYNKDLDFSKSNHVVVSYNHLFSTNLRLKVEAYYQALFNIPVETRPSYVSVLNYGKSFAWEKFNEMINDGTGTNYGIELTFEKFLDKGFYFLVTTSLYDSKYKGSDGIERNTGFNGKYVVNALGGYEFAVGKQKNNTLSFDCKIASAGGLYDIPIDLAQSRFDEEAVYDYTKAYTYRHPNYFRLDLRVTFRMNNKKFSQEWAFDVQNATNHSNHFIEMYNADTGELEQSSQMGLFPMMLWRINF